MDSICINNGYLSNITINEKIELNDVSFFISNTMISDIFVLKPVFEAFRKTNKNLIILATDFHWKVIADMKNYNKIYSINCICVKIPTSTADYNEYYQDIAVLTGGVVISDFKNINKFCYGGAEKVVCTINKTEIYNPVGKSEQINERIKIIENNIKNSESEVDKSIMINRLSQLFNHTYIEKIETINSNDIDKEQKHAPKLKKHTQTYNKTENIKPDINKNQNSNVQKRFAYTQTNTNEMSDNIADKHKGFKSVRLLGSAVGFTFGLIICILWIVFNPEITILILDELILYNKPSYAVVDVFQAIVTNVLPAVAGLIGGFFVDNIKKIWLSFIVPIVVLIIGLLVGFIMAFIVLLMDNFMASVVGIIILCGLFGGGGYRFIIFIFDRT